LQFPHTWRPQRAEQRTRGAGKDVLYLGLTPALLSDRIDNYPFGQQFPFIHPCVFNFIHTNDIHGRLVPACINVRRRSSVRGRTH